MNVRRPPGRILYAADTSTAALAAKAITLTLPTHGLSDGVDALDVSEHRAVRLVFAMAGDAGDLMNYQVVLWTVNTPLASAGATTRRYIPRVVAKGNYVAGSTTFAVAGLNETTDLLADTINEQIGHPRVSVYNPVDNTFAEMVVDCEGAHYLTVETDLSTGAPSTATVLVDLLDELPDWPRPVGYSSGYATGQALAAAAGDAASPIVRIPIPPGATRLFLEVKNSGAVNAFDDFFLQRRCHILGSWEEIAGEAGDFSSPTSPLLECTGAPVTLAALATCHMRIDVTGTESINVVGSSAVGGATTVEYYWRTA